MVKVVKFTLYQSLSSTFSPFKARKDMTKIVNNLFIKCALLEKCRTTI